MVETQGAAAVPMELTWAEGLYLSDCLTMYHAAHPDCQDYNPFPGLLLKIGAVVLARAPVMVSLTPDELWCIREEAKSSVKVGTENVGLNLLAKVYAALLEIAADSVTEGLPQSEADEGTYRQRAKIETPETKGERHDNQDDNAF